MKKVPVKKVSDHFRSDTFGDFLYIEILKTGLIQLWGKIAKKIGHFVEKTQNKLHKTRRYADLFCKMIHFLYSLGII